VLISGGPGLYDDRDVEHDKSWANYVTPPLLLTDTAKKHKDFKGGSSVYWLVYRPAYLERWIDDVADKRRSVREVRNQGFASYTALIEGRARKRQWTLRWFGSADDLWARLRTFQDPIAQVWYWGHARNDLWLTLAHSSSATPVRPDTAAVVTVDSIGDNAALAPRFPRGRIHQFVGCNTAAFAQEWSRVFGGFAGGVVDVVDFGKIHQNGGHPGVADPKQKVVFEDGKVLQSVP